MNRATIAILIGLAMVISARALAQKPEAVDLKTKGDQLLSSGSKIEAEAAFRKAIAADPNYLDVYFALSALYLRDGEFEKAITLLRVAVKRSPTYAEGWYNLAYALRKKGDLDSAIEAYRVFGKLRPISADPHYGLALALKAKGDLKGAASSFRRYASLEHSPDKRSWIKKSLDEAARLEAEAAKIDQAARGRKVEPSGNEGGKGAEGKGAAGAKGLDQKAAVREVKPAGSDATLPMEFKTEKATEEQKAIRPEQKQAQSLKAEGDRLVKSGRMEDAIDRYRRAIATDYSYVAAYNELGNVLFAMKRYDEAIRTFRISIRDNPDFSLGWYNLAFSLRKAGHLEEAIAAYRKYSHLKPSDPDPYFGLALAYISLGKKTEAVKAYQTYIEKEKRETQQTWIHKARVEIARLEGREPPTEATVEASSEATGEKAKPKTKAELAKDAKAKADEAKRIAAEEKQRKADEAKEAKRIAAEEKKRIADEAKRKVDEEKRTKEETRRIAAEEKKRKIAEEKGTEAKGTAAAKVKGVEAKKDDGEHSEAEEVVVNVTPTPDVPVEPAPPSPSSVGPGSSDAVKLRVQADSLARQGKCAQAYPFYKEALKRSPFELPAFDGIAYCAFKIGELEDGARVVALGIRDNPDYTRGWLHLARLQRKARREDRAVGSYRRYLATPGFDPNSRLELARALRALGMKEEAIRAYTEFLKVKDPRSEAAPPFAAARLELAALGGPVVSVEAEKPKAKTKAELAKDAKAKAEETKRVATDEKKRKAEEAKEAIRVAAEEKKRRAEEERGAREAAKRLSTEEKKRRAEEDKVATKERGTLGADLAHRLGDDSMSQPVAPAETGSSHDETTAMPDAAKALATVADEQFAKGRYLLATGLYQQAAKLDEKNAELVFRAGLAALAANQMTLAADCFAKVLKLDPKSRAATASLSLAKAGAGKLLLLQKPETTFETAKKAFADKKYIEAEKILDTLVARISTKHLMLRAEARLAQGKAQLAFNDAASAFALDPKATDALRLMGEAQRAGHNQGKALYYYREFLKRTPGNSGNPMVRARVEQLVEELKKSR